MDVLKAMSALWPCPPPVAGLGGDANARPAAAMPSAMIAHDLDGDVIRAKGPPSTARQTQAVPPEGAASRA
jgi:hypothetical protein